MINKSTREEIADAADMIVNGYAYLRNGDYIKCVDLDDIDSVALFDRDLNLIALNMYPIGLVIAEERLRKNIKYMED